MGLFKKKEQLKKVEKKSSKKPKTARKDSLGLIKKKTVKAEAKSVNSKVSLKTHAVINELFGVLSLALGVILFCALFSYSPEDSGIHVQGDTGALNWIGPGGALIADIGFMLFGLMGYVLALGLIAFGGLCFLSRQKIITGVRAAGFIISFLSLSILIDGLDALAPELLYGPGGLIGEQLNLPLVNIVSNIGATILSLAGFLIGFILLTSVSIGDALRVLGSSIVFVTHESMKFFKNLFDKMPAVSLPKSEGFFAKLALNKSDSNTESSNNNLKLNFSNQESHKNSQDSKNNKSFWDIHKHTDEAEKVKAEEVAAVVGEKTIDLPKENADGAEIQIIERDIEESKRAVDEAEKEIKKKKVSRSYALPPLSLLNYDAPEAVKIDPEKLKAQAAHLEQTFSQFSIAGHVREVRPGPVVTMFEFVPAPGVKLSRIAALSDDIAMAMEAVHVRIVAPIPGKGAVGIELPNEHPESVYLKEVVSDPAYRETKHKLTMAIGKNIDGKPYFVNLASMPHLLVAGTTGSGKSVSVNAMICSILYRATPDDVKFIMVDPKMLELSIYEGIPHLMLPPIIDSKKAGNALRWAVKEMDERYMLLNEMGVRDIVGYNLKLAKKVHDNNGKEVLSKKAEKPFERLPYIVIVVDEYADLIAVGGRDVEAQVMRLAQKARASGIHVILATQRPSVDIITGVIKANFPVRIGFRLASSHDSKTIVNRPGAEKLLGKGDMLIMPPGKSDLTRIHGAFVSETELNRVVDFWKEQGTPDYNMEILDAPAEELGANGEPKPNDERYEEAIDVVCRTGKGTVSWLQRHLGVGYNRAAKMVEQMELEGIIGPTINARGDREVFGRKEE